MSERASVVLALSPLVEQTIQPLLFGDQAAVTVAATVDEPAALERIVLAIPAAEALLLSADLPGLTPALLTRVRSHGLRLIGIATSDIDTGVLRDLAVDTVLTSPIDTAALQTAVRSPAGQNGHAEPRAISAAEPGHDRDQRKRSGAVLAVVGGRRSPGASELAGSLAALASDRWQTILVELDLLGGSLALRLGADAGQGSMLGLLRATGNGEPALRELLERWLVTRPGWPPILLAPPQPQRALIELDLPGATRAALDSLAELYPLVIADVGFLLTRAGEVGSVERCHREALVAADSVILVLGAREAQLDGGLAQLDLLLNELAVPAERLRVVCNGVGGPGAIPQPQLDQTLTAALGERRLTIDALLPWDSRALTKATRSGLPLAAAHQRGAYAQTAKRLLDTVFLPTAPVARGRKQLLPQPTPATAEQPRREDEKVALPWRR